MTIIIIAAVLVITGVAIFLMMRNRLKSESDGFDDEITRTLTLPVRSSYDMARDSASQENARQFADIEDALEGLFNDRYVSGSDEETFTGRFSDVFNEAYSLRRRLEAFQISPSDRLEKLISDYGSIHDLVRRHNEAVIKARLDRNRDFFDHCLTYPLDGQQRRSIVSEENNCLVVSSAGSGKTSSIVGKVKYLTEKLNVDPERILLISYTNKADGNTRTQRLHLP